MKKSSLRTVKEKNRRLILRALLTEGGLSRIELAKQTGLSPSTITALVGELLAEGIVQENGLTTLMITHNMKDAIVHGNRLIMMYEGHIIYDVAGEEKKNLKVSDLLAKFEEVSGGEFANDRMMLTN